MTDLYMFKKLEKFKTGQILHTHTKSHTHTHTLISYQNCFTGKTKTKTKPFLQPEKANK